MAARAIQLPILGALLLACAGKAEPSSPLEPRLGQDQALPSIATQSETPVAPAAGPSPGEWVPLETVMVGALHTPDPDPERLRQTDAARIHKQDGLAKIGFCVAEDGTTTDIEVLINFPGDPTVDAIFVETIASWRFKPLVVGGQAIKVCTSHVYRLQFEGNASPSSSADEHANAGEPEDPAPDTNIPPPAQVTAEDEKLCRHITAVVLSESGNAAGLNDEEVEELIASCSVAVAQDRRKLGETEFRKRAACVRKAKSVEGFSACQPEQGED
jgi:hypothetical protein